MNGDDILELFKSCNISLGNLKPNVVRSWYHTDDKDMKELLNWMCTSISSTNYVSPLEIEKYNKIRDEITQNDIAKVEKQYTNIFDVDALRSEVRQLEDEINMLREEEQRLDQGILMHNVLKKRVVADHHDTNKLETQTSVKYETVMEKCKNLSHELDRINEELFHQTDKFHQSFNEFEIYRTLKNNITCNFSFKNSDNSRFITTFNVEDLRKEFDNEILLFDIPTINEERELSKSCISVNDMFKKNNLTIIRERIFNSQTSLLSSKVERRRTKAVLDYLNNIDFQSALLLTETDSSELQADIEVKREIMKTLCNVLEDVAQKITDYKVSFIETKDKKRELLFYQNQLDDFQTVEDEIFKILSLFCALEILYKEEKSIVQMIYNHFKYVNNVNQSLFHCANRIDKMQEIIEKERSLPEKRKFNILIRLAQIIADGKECDLSTAFEIFHNFQHQLEQLERQVFDNNDLSLNNALKENVKILETFLISGPTKQPVLFPCNVSNLMREIGKMSEKQAAVIKNIVRESTNKKPMSKWDNYRRWLWMFFYLDHPKLKLVLEQIKIQCSKMHRE